MRIALTRCAEPVSPLSPRLLEDPDPLPSIVVTPETTALCLAAALSDDDLHPWRKTTGPYVTITTELSDGTVRAVRCPVWMASHCPGSRRWRTVRLVSVPCFRLAVKRWASVSGLPASALIGSGGEKKKKKEEEHVMISRVEMGKLLNVHAVAASGRAGQPGLQRVLRAGDIPGERPHHRTCQAPPSRRRSPAGSKPAGISGPAAAARLRRQARPATAREHH